MSERLCKVCGRQWCPHPANLPSGKFTSFVCVSIEPRKFKETGSVPEWLLAEWFTEVCGGCAKRFMCWAFYYSNGAYARNQYELFHEGELYFTRWLAYEFKKDLEIFVDRGSIRTFCGGHVRGVNCNKLASRDGFCGRHHPSHQKENHEEFWS